MSSTQAPRDAAPLIGRDRELAILRDRLGAALAGHGELVLIGGEAGIGKSRLVAEARAAAAGMGMLVLEGRCFEPDRSVPYAPLLALLRAYAADQPAGAVPRDLARLGPEFADLAPELARFLPDRAPAGVPAADHAHYRRVHSLAHFLGALAAERALLLIVEDVHWSDDASLDALLVLARQLTDRSALLVCTYRSDEVAPSLRHTLAQLDRERLADEISLSRLPPPDIDAMLRAIFDQQRPIRADFLRAIHELTDGNPFFIEEVVRALIAAGEIFRSAGRWERRSLEQLHIPRSVEDAVTRRVAMLGAGARGMIRVAAVAGRSFDFGILQALTDRDERALLDLLHEAVAAQLVVEESADRYTFRHALTRQAIYATMLARERRSLHLAVAELIEQRHASMPEPYFADLSQHFSAGEAWEKALTYGELAGARALSLDAPQAAAEHFTRAVDAATRLATPPPVRLYRARGRAFAMVGEFDRALADYQVAFERAHDEADDTAEWQALRNLGDLWMGYDYTRSGAYFERALALARMLGRPPLIAESLMLLGGWYLNIERVDEAEASLQDALAIFERIGDRHSIARSIDLLGTVSDIAGDIVAMRRRYEEAAAIFRDLGDRQGLCSTLATMLIATGVHVFETVVVPPLISLGDALTEADEALTIAQDIGWRAGEAYIVATTGMCFSAFGRYGEAVERVRTGLAIAQEIDHHEWTIAGEWELGMTYTDLLDPVRAHAHLKRAWAIAQGSGSLHWIHLLTGSLAENCVVRGDIGGAAEILTPFLPGLPMRTLGQRRVWVAHVVLALARGDAAEALRCVDRLFAGASNYTGDYGIPLLALLRGRALAALHRYGEAESTLAAALRATTDGGLLPFQWRVHAALGHVYEDMGRAADARAHFHAAGRVIEALAATVTDEPLRDGFLAAAAAMLPTERAIRSRRDHAILTVRERDVARLVAHGCSNREIADRLSIGERTVETHVGNILSKLEFGSRAQIAAWAVEIGLGRATD